ncbi:MAG: hypothetical protein WCE68_14940 [Anaerolineales bacterium]
MTPILVNCALTLLALLLAFFAFWRWRKSKRFWYIICAVAAILAAFSFWLSRINGSFLLVCALLLFALAALFKKKAL